MFYLPVIIMALGTMLALATIIAVIATEVPPRRKARRLASNKAARLVRERNITRMYGAAQLAQILRHKHTCTRP